jgi:hypothetical protein
MVSHFFVSTRCLRWALPGLLLVVSAAPPVASSTLNGHRGEALAGAATSVRIEVHDRADLRRLTRLVSIDNVRGNWVLASATPPQLAALRAAGYRWEVVPTAAKADAVMCPDGWVEDGDRSWSCYPTYDQYISMMNRCAAVRPEICRLVDLGPTANAVRPHRLLAVIISDNPGLEEDEPEVLLTSTIHGDETTGYMLTLRLIDHLLSEYGSDEDVTDLVDSTEIWINPLANPDGTYFGGNDSVTDAIRYYTTSAGANSGVDGNRNFPSMPSEEDPDGSDHPDGRSWWPETEAMMALAASETFVLSANFHGGAEVVNYPWDTVDRRHPDDDWFEDLSRDWAELAQSDGPAGYMTDPYSSGVTNGYDWYQTFGSRQDWVTYFQGGRELTIELSNTKLPPAADLDDYWQWNRRALLDFIDHARHGIRGVVTDQNGAPLAATVEVVGLDTVADGSKVHTDPDVGDFHRLLLPGLYDLEIRAEGCVAKTVHGIAVGGGEPTRVDASLWCTQVLRPSRRVAP